LPAKRQIVVNGGWGSAAGRRAQGEPSRLPKPEQARQLGEVVGFGLLFSFLMLVGIVWAWATVKLAMLVSEVLTLQNILRTYQ
jgi:hypothetical protein